MVRHAFACSFTLVSVLCFAACGGDVLRESSASSGAGGGATASSSANTSTSTSTSTGTTTSSSTNSSTGGGGGGSAPHGDCTTDADCAGGTCAPITPGGWLICLDVPPEATSCTSPQGALNQCCTSADCAHGKCYSTQDLPYCGGPVQQIYNACLSDECTADSDCSPSAPSLCAPAGAFDYPVRHCVRAYCHTDADCTEQPGGLCAPVMEPCCGTAAGLGCVYRGGCRRNADCGSGDNCQLDSKTGTGKCMTGPAPCPV